MDVQTVKQQIMQSFDAEEFKTPVVSVTFLKDVELLVSQEMIKVVEKNFPIGDQESFVEKMYAYRASVLAKDPSQRELLGNTMTKDSITYMTAILVSIISENSGYKEVREQRKAKGSTPRLENVDQSQLDRNFSVYLIAIQELYELLKMDSFLMESFKTSQALLKHFYLAQLILSPIEKQRELGVNFSLLLYRFDSNTTLSQITSDFAALEILGKQNVRDMWRELSDQDTKIKAASDKTEIEDKLHFMTIRIQQAEETMTGINGIQVNKSGGAADKELDVSVVATNSPPQSEDKLVTLTDRIQHTETMMKSLNVKLIEMEDDVDKALQATLEATKTVSNREIEEKLNLMTLRTDQTEALMKNLNELVIGFEKGGASASSNFDFSQVVDIKKFDHCLSKLETKIESLNPGFLMTLGTRMENFDSSIAELRDLYQSPSSSLNMVLDGLLKKIKSVEASHTGYGRQQSVTVQPPVAATGAIGAPVRYNAGNDGNGYRREITSHGVDRGPSSLTSGRITKQSTNRASQL